VWLPPKDGFHVASPSIGDIKAISISLLAPPLDVQLFRTLPKVISLPFDRVNWHYNPLCHGCRYEPDCRARSQDQGELGSMPNISIDDAKALKDLLRDARRASPPNQTDCLSDIEELHHLIANHSRLDNIAKSSPTVVKKAKQVLQLPKKVREQAEWLPSPIVEAARTKMLQVSRQTSNEALQVPLILNFSGSSST